LFEISALPVDEEGLKRKFTELLSHEHDQIIGLLANYRNAYYPGHEILKEGKKRIEDILGINDTATYYKKVWEIREELNSYAVQANEVKSFFDNQKDIFDKAQKVIDIFNYNRTYVTDKEVIQ